MTLLLLFVAFGSKLEFTFKKSKAITEGEKLIVTVSIDPSNSDNLKNKINVLTYIFLIKLVVYSSLRFKNRIESVTTICYIILLKIIYKSITLSLSEN
jgi:hypothetical protein